MKRLLFITWDGPQTNYLESLFYPVFDAIRQQRELEFHIIQFTWGHHEKIRQTKDQSILLGFHYVSMEVNRFPHPAFGAFYAAWKGSKFIQQYIEKNQIDIVMPRSTMPALMINRIQNKINNVKIIFDADGLPLEERVDFAGLKKKSFQYKKLKSEETQLLENADAVITRSNKAIDIHRNNFGQEYLPPFFKVINGRDIKFFSPDDGLRKKHRDELGVSPHEILFIYCGSLGPQYGWEDMLSIFSQYHALNPDAQFLILTGTPDFLSNKIPDLLKNKIMIRSVPYAKIPAYLNTGDIAFALRQPTYSMQGVAPIKLGEYLLMGLPTIASKGIGDTEELIPLDSCFLYDHKDPQRIEKVVNWSQSIHTIDKNKIRAIGLKYFSLEESVKSYLNVIDTLCVPPLK